jgi:ATP/maltotriose-dependent transcriptional regulator MalT
MYVNGINDLFRLGRWDEAERRLLEAERLDLDVTAAALHHAIAGQLLGLRGDAAAARAHLEQALVLAGEPLPAEFVAPIHTGWAALAFALDDADSAQRHVEAAFDAIGDEKDPLYTPPLHWLGVRAAADLAERGRARRRSDELAAARRRADALVGDLAAILEPSAAGSPPADGVAFQALTCAEQGRVEGRSATEPWADAASAFEALREPFPAAYARYREAEARLAAGGERAAAVDALLAAHGTTVELSARPLREAVEALARRARIVLAAPGPPPADHGSEGGLTPREAQVLQLLADGLTNREIGDRLYISEKTVGTHIAHIFEKLDVHNRIEAASRARQLGVLQP